MKPHERKQWIVVHMKNNSGPVDVLNAPFSDAYIKATDAKFRPSMWGAHFCRQLGADLSAMARCNALKRFRVGLSGNWQPGFPKWVWCYELGPAAYLYDVQPEGGSQ